MAYVAPYATDKTRKQIKRRVYNVLLKLAMNGSTPSDLRIVSKFPCTNLKRVWMNLHASAVSEAVKSNWYMAIHNLLPTNERLAAINLTYTTACTSCGHLDSLQHRITDCGDSPIIWTWTKQKLGVILRMDHRYIRQDWTLPPFFSTGPRRNRWRFSGSWLTSFIIAYSLIAAFLFWIIWTFCIGPEGSYITKHAGPSSQEGIWMSSTV